MSMRANYWLPCGLLSLAPVLSGCAGVARVSEETSLLPKPRMSRDAVVIEMLTVEMPINHLCGGGSDVARGG